MPPRTDLFPAYAALEAVQGSENSERINEPVRGQDQPCPWLCCRPIHASFVMCPPFAGSPHDVLA